MANSILSSLFSTPSLRVVDERTKTVRWAKIKVRAVEIDSESDNAINPISDSQINDNGTYRLLLEADIKQSKIIRPSKLRISAFVPDVSMMNAIIQAFNDVEGTLQITSKSMIADSMVIVNLEVEQKPEHLSAYLVSIELEQAIPPSDADSYDPSQDGDKASVGVRVQSPSGSALSVQGLYNRASGAVSGALTGITNRITSIL